MTTNTTIRNLTKQSRLTTEHVFPKHIVSHPSTTRFLSSLLLLNLPKEEIIYNLGKQLLANNSNPVVQTFLEERSYPSFTFSDVPEEFDLLGAVYQYLNSKYENLTMGSFYTSYKLARVITQGMKFDEGQTLIDPSCGSGVFLFASDAPPEQLYGVDFDPIAVMIAKFNFFLKFPDATVYPKIYHADFLDWYKNNQDKKFTHVVGNPPYGANLDLSTMKSPNILTGESFSYFIEYGFYMLEDEGTLNYLLPESLLNVKRHIDIRDFILDKTNLTKIKKYDTKFAGVMSDIYEIQLDKKSNTETLQFIADGSTEVTVKQSFKELKNHIFAPVTRQDADIISKVKSRATATLKGSLFGLGVVTGDNATKLLDAPSDETEIIFTGKEIEKYRFIGHKKHIVFDRTKLQQVAPDFIYRAEAKLVYKVISKRLKVVIDLSQSLTSSSANIIVPNIAHNTVYSVALLLNSDLYSFLNQKLHGSTNKVSRDNLEALPFPEFTPEQLVEIQSLVESYLKGETLETVLQKYVVDYFSISAGEEKHIQESI